MTFVSSVFRSFYIVGMNVAPFRGRGAEGGRSCCEGGETFRGLLLKAARVSRCPRLIPTLATHHERVCGVTSVRGDCCIAQLQGYMAYRALLARTSIMNSEYFRVHGLSLGLFKSVADVIRRPSSDSDSGL